MDVEKEASRNAGRKKLPRDIEELKHDLLVRCIGGGESVEAVAAHLKIGKATAYRLLRKVNTAETVIRPTIVAPRPEGDDLRTAVEKICHRHGIRHVEILASPALDRELLGSTDYWSTIRRSLGAMAAKYVEGLFDRGELPRTARIGLSGGRAAQSFSDVVFGSASTSRSKTALNRELLFYPLSLISRWRVLTHAGASGIVQRLVHRFEYDNATSAGLRVKVFSPEVTPRTIRELHPNKKAWARYPEIDAIYGPGAQPPDLIVTGIGYRWYVDNKGPETPHEETSRFVRRLAEGSFYYSPRPPKRDGAQSTPLKIKDYLFQPLPEWAYEQANETLWNAKAAAELFRCAIRADGTTVPASKLDPSALGIGVEVSRVRDWVGEGTKSVAMVGTSRSAAALRAVLETGCVSVLVLDTAAAVQLTRFEDAAHPDRRPTTPPPFQHVPLVLDPPKVAQPTPKLAPTTH